ncbi:hypothetical protein [Larkinella arboricola]|uniref:hypothetical protein n=1 Tax=Larkinella arboricola TaxID=643671 RepID=UPI001474AB7B|nr:hypothetical protein [Larkinella arboricola]
MYAEEYSKALKGTDKEYAQMVGREYYSALRQGLLTEDDEKTIASDLAAMDESSFR